MRTIPPRQRSTLARRIAAGLPVWAAAKGSNLPAEEVGELMGEPEFRELIGAWADILDMAPEARTDRLRRLAHMVIEHKLQNDCDRTASFVLRETRRRRDPVVTLAKGFHQLTELEQARALRENAARAAAPPVGDAPAGDPPPAAMAAEAEPSVKPRLRAHPDDTMLWRKAGALRCDMIHEQLLFSAVAEREAARRRKVPLEPEELAAIEAAQVAVFEARQAEARCNAEAETAARPFVSPEPEPAAEAEETDAAFNARAVAMLNETLAQAPPEIRELLKTFSQDQLWALVERCWPSEGELGQAQPQGP